MEIIMKITSFKHALALMLCILMAFSLFACDASKETVTDEETTTVEETTVEETTVEETTAEETTVEETTTPEETTNAEETSGVIETPREEAYFTTEMSMGNETCFYEHHRSADGKILYTLVRSFAAYGIVIYRMDYSYDSTTNRLSEIDISFCDTRIEYEAYAQLLTHIGEYRFVSDESGVTGTYYKLNSRGEYIPTSNTMSIKYDGAHVVEAVVDYLAVTYENGVKKSEIIESMNWTMDYTYNESGSTKSLDIVMANGSESAFALEYDEHGYLTAVEFSEGKDELEGMYFTFDPETGYSMYYKMVSADYGVENFVAEFTLTYTEKGGISSVNTVGYSRLGDGTKNEFKFNFAMSYNEDGQVTLITETEFDNNEHGKREKHYSYDENGNLSEEIKLYWYPDLNGNLTEEYSSEEKYSYKYDELGRLTEKKTESSDGDDFTDSYTYDEYDRIIIKEENGTKINDGIMGSVPVFKHILHEYTYHQNGERSSETRTNYDKSGEIIDKMLYEYNEDGEVTAEKMWEGNSEGQLVQTDNRTYTYTREYDDAGELVKKITEIITYDETGAPTDKEVRTETYSGNSVSGTTDYYTYSNGEWVKRQ